MLTATNLAVDVSEVAANPVASMPPRASASEDARVAATLGLAVATFASLQASDVELGYSMTTCLPLADSATMSTTASGLLDSSLARVATSESIEAPDEFAPSFWLLTASPRTSAKSIASARSDLTQVAEALSSARAAVSRRLAYDVFDRLARFIRDSYNPSALRSIAVFLRDSSAPFRSVLLSCLADHDIAIQGEDLLGTIASLCGSSDRDLARAAAAALDSGGPTAHTRLEAAILALPPDHQRDIQRFLAFVSSI